MKRTAAGTCAEVSARSTHRRFSIADAHPDVRGPRRGCGASSASRSWRFVRIWKRVLARLAPSRRTPAAMYSTGTSSWNRSLIELTKIIARPAPPQRLVEPFRAAGARSKPRSSGVHGCAPRRSARRASRRSSARSPARPWCTRSRGSRSPLSTRLRYVRTPRAITVPCGRWQVQPERVAHRSLNALCLSRAMCHRPRCVTGPRLSRKEPRPRQLGGPRAGCRQSPGPTEVSPRLSDRGSAPVRLR